MAGNNQVSDIDHFLGIGTFGSGKAETWASSSVWPDLIDFGTKSGIELPDIPGQIAARVATVEAAVFQIQRGMNIIVSLLQQFAEANTQALSTEERTIVLKTMSDEEAREAIIGVFEEEETLYYSDIAEKVGIGLEDAVRFCRELEDEGIIKGAE